MYLCLTLIDIDRAVQTGTLQLSSTGREVDKTVLFDRAVVTDCACADSTLHLHALSQHLTQTSARVGHNTAIHQHV